MNVAWLKYLPPFIRQKLEGRQQLQQAINNTGWLFADRFLRMGIGLIVSIWVTRYLGPERYGIFSYATAFVSLISSIALLGLDSITVRNLVSDPSRRDEILGSCFFLKLIGGAVAFIITMASIWLIRPSDPVSQQLVAIIAIGTMFQIFGVADFWFQSQVKAKYSVYARSGANIIICVVKVVLIMISAPLAAFAWAGVAEITIGSLGLMIAYRATGHHMFAWRATRSMATELLRDSWPILFTEIVILIYLRVDRIMIGEMNGNIELGVYSVAAMLAEAFYFIPLAVNSSLFPSIVEAKAISDELFYTRLQQYYNLMALLAYGVAILATCFAWWLVPLMFGAAYSKAGLMFMGLAWAGLFYNLMVARSYFLIAMNWTRLHFITDFLGCVLNIALNFWLIPRYGGMGAVVASIVSYWFVAHGSCFVFKPLYKTGTMLTRAMFYPKIW